MGVFLFLMMFVKTIETGHSKINLIKSGQENLMIARTTQMLAHDVRKPFNLVQGIMDVIALTPPNTDIDDL